MAKPKNKSTKKEKKQSEQTSSLPKPKSIVTPKKLEVKIHPDCIYKIRTWVDNCDIEVSGMGIVEFVENIAYVTDVFLVDQVCSGSETEMKAEALADLEYEVFKMKKRGSLNFWWHSHANMPVFWSGTDMNAISDMGGNGFILSTVFNKKSELRTSFFQGASGFLPSIWVDEIPTSIGAPEGDDRHTALLKELADKVERNTYQSAYKTPYDKKFPGYQQEMVLHGNTNYLGQPISKIEEPEEENEAILKSKHSYDNIPAWIYGSTKIDPRDALNVYLDFEDAMDHVPTDLHSLELYYDQWWSYT